LKIKKLLSSALIIMLFVSFSSFSNGTSKNIVRESPKIAGKSSNLFYIEMGNGRTGEITIGSGKFYTVDKANSHIQRKISEKSKTVSIAINGGYFDAYTSDFRTYATIVQNGKCTNGGGSASKPTLGFTSTGEPLIDRVQIQSKVILRNTVEIVPWSVNTWYPDASAIILFNSLLGKKIDIPKTSTLVYIKNNVVSKIVSGTAASLNQIPSDTVVLVYNQTAFQNSSKYGNDPKPGNSAEVVSIKVPSQTQNQSKWDDIVTAVSAGPMIILNGKDVTDENSDFTEAKQSPTFVSHRSFAAILRDGRLVLGTVTASPKQLAPYLISIGAVSALSLDGGASTMLYEKDSGFIVPAGRNLSNVISIVDYSTGTLPPLPVKTDTDSPSSWAAANIKEANAIGLIPDNLKGAYKTNITRQEFCNLAMKLITINLGEDNVTKMLNASGISYNSARATFIDAYHIDVMNCYRLGIIGGKGNGIFDPNGSLTRQEAAKILTNICKILEITPTGQTPTFNDQDKISSWAEEYVSFICRAGIMSGKGTGFDPLGYYSRQEAVITMLRIHNIISN
jgi:hypothetical protein